MKRFGRRPGMILSGGWLGVLMLAAYAGPWLGLADPARIDLGNILTAPSGNHWLGTDSLGRDLFARMIYGARISLSVGFVAVGISFIIGVFIGATAGYAGKTLDRILMAFVDLMLCFPVLFLILAMVALLEPGLVHIMVVIGLTSWMGIARLVRAEVLSLKERDFVRAAQVMGAGFSHILLRHILPNALGPALVALTLGVADAILIESALSFLGIGVQPPTPSWGNILADGRTTLGAAWWMMAFPGMAILVTVLSYNHIAQTLRESSRSAS